MNEEELKDVDKELDKISKEMFAPGKTISVHPKTIYEKILYIQLELQGMKKDKDGYNYKYYDINGLLAQLKPLLKKYGLLVMQNLTHIEGKPALETTVLSGKTDHKQTLELGIVVKTKDSMSWTTPLPTNTTTKNGMTETDPQRMGAVITYYRRYALASLFLLEAEDNDAAK